MKRRPTIAGGMMVVLVVAILLAVYRAGSFLGLAALLPFGITATIARRESGPSGYRRALAVGAAGTLLIPFLMAIWINGGLWGYYVSRPALDRRIVEASRIESVTRVATVPDSLGNRSFSGAPVRDVGPFIQVHPQAGDYYVLEGRILRALTERQSLPSEAGSMPDERLASLYQLLDQTGRIEAGEPGYGDARKLDGIVVEALERDGRPLLFVGVRGGEVSNDHHPYYEFLFTSGAPNRRPRLLSFRRFYFDVDGIEGAEWPIFFPILACLGLIPTIPLQGFSVWRGRLRSARPAGSP
jgi:hypothetical protein